MAYTPEYLDALWARVATLNEAISQTERELNNNHHSYTWAEDQQAFVLTYALEGMRKHRKELIAEIDENTEVPGVEYP